MNNNYSKAADVNKAPIWACLQRYVHSYDSILEIGSGFGQHAKYFLEQQPTLNILATDKKEKLQALKENVTIEPNITTQILDVSVCTDWPSHTFDVIYSANTLHIMSETSVIHCFSHLGVHVKAEGYIVFYGPFNVGGKFTTPSNAEFDAYLKSKDPDMGLRCVDWLKEIAESSQLKLTQIHEMPSNNKILVFEKLK